jgi:hypothetical protein
VPFLDQDVAVALGTTVGEAELGEAVVLGADAHGSKSSGVGHVVVSSVCVSVSTKPILAHLLELSTKKSNLKSLFLVLLFQAALRFIMSSA